MPPQNRRLSERQPPTSMGKGCTDFTVPPIQRAMSEPLPVQHKADLHRDDRVHTCSRGNERHTGPPARTTQHFGWMGFDAHAKGKSRKSCQKPLTVWFLWSSSPEMPFVPYLLLASVLHKPGRKLLPCLLSFDVPP